MKKVAKFFASTLSFILGFILGPVLLIVAIVGALVGVGMGVKVSDLPFNLDSVIDEESDLYNSTVWEALQGVVGDIQNFDNLSMKDLYEHYGIALLKGISGLDFTTKEFYSTPLTKIIGDWSILTNELTLEDVGTVAKLDFEKYGLPIIDDNMSVGLTTAIDNIMGSFNGNLSVRAIKDMFGIDLGVEDNDMLAKMQDIRLSDFGSVINFLRVNTLLDADTDLFIKAGAQQVYTAADAYVEVSDPKSLAVTQGVETYIAGAKDTDGDGVNDALDERELRYVQKEVDGEVKYVVDNSCYAADYDSASGKKFYRHIQYSPVGGNSATGTKYILAYANRIATINGENFTLVEGEYIALDDIFDPTKNNATYANATLSNGKVTINSLSVQNSEGEFEVSERYGMTDEPITKDSVLSEKADGEYLKAHIGEAEAAIQTIAYMTINDLKDAGDILGNRKIKELIPMNDKTSKIIKALADSTLNTIGEDIDFLTFEDMLDIVPFNYTEDANGKYVQLEDGSYTLYNPALHKDVTTRYNREETPGASSLVLQRLRTANLKGLDDMMKEIALADVIDLDPDVYREATPEEVANYKDTEKESNLRVYRYDEEKKIFALADKADMSDDETYYVVDIEGSSNSILKKLAYVNVQEMDSALDTVMDDTFLSELVTINEAYGVAIGKNEYKDPEANPDQKYFYEWHEGGQEINGKPVLFVLDRNGSYFLSDFIYEEATAEQLGSPETVYYVYKPLKEHSEFTEAPSATALKLALSFNLYYSADGETFNNNLQLCSYLAAKIKTNADESANKLYYREKADMGTEKAIEGKVYNSSSETLYVDIMGNMYDMKTGTPALAGGSSVSTMDEDTRKVVFCNLTPYVKKTKQESEAGFFVEISDRKYNYTEGANTYSLEYCEDVYVVNAEGAYVCIDGAYIEDADKSKYPDAETRFEKRVGIVVPTAQVYLTDGVTHLNKNDIYVVEEVLYEESSPVLKYLANSTVKSLNKKLSDASLSSIIDIAPGTIFDVESIRNSTLSNLGASVQEALNKDITIGDLLKWGQVDQIPAEVVDVIKDATIRDFFASLKFENGLIIVDVEELFNKQSERA